MAGKGYGPGRDKMLRPDGDKKTSISELTAELKAAQKLLSLGEADAIIGEQDDEYRAIMAGMRALMALHWAAMQQRGLKPTPDATQDAGKALIMAVSLVHEAYALGIRKARRDGDVTVPGAEETA